MNYLLSHRCLISLALSVVMLVGCGHWSCCFAESPHPGAHDRPTGALITKLTCNTNRITAGDTFVLTVGVENPTEGPQDIDIRGFSWDKIAQLKRMRADMQSRINAPRPDQNQIDTLDMLLVPYRQSAAPQIIGMFHVTNLQTKETHMMDRVNAWCGTGRQIASMPPGASVTNRIEIEAAWLPDSGDFGIEFRVFGRVDGKRKPVAISNQVRVSVHAADGQSAKAQGDTQQAGPR